MLVLCPVYYVAGQPDPSLACLNWNPIPWKDIIEEPKTDVLKDPGRKKSFSI
jgi:hypothetical protein